MGVGIGGYTLLKCTHAYSVKEPFPLAGVVRQFTFGSDDSFTIYFFNLSYFIILLFILLFAQ